MWFGPMPGDREPDKADAVQIYEAFQVKEAMIENITTQKKERYATKKHWIGIL